MSDNLEKRVSDLEEWIVPLRPSAPNQDIYNRILNRVLARTPAKSEVPKCLFKIGHRVWWPGGSGTVLKALWREPERRWDLLVEQSDKQPLWVAPEFCQFEKRCPI